MCEVSFKTCYIKSMIVHHKMSLTVIFTVFFVNKNDVNNMLSLCAVLYSSKLGSYKKVVVRNVSLMC